MKLSNDSLKSIVGIGVGIGALALGFVSIKVPDHVVQLLTSGGELALGLRDGQGDALVEVTEKVSKAVERDHRQWIAAEFGHKLPDEKAIKAAMDSLGDSILETKPSVNDVVAAGLNEKEFVKALKKRLPENSPYAQESTVEGRLFTAMICGVHGLARTDKNLKPLFDSLSFEKIFDSFGAAQADREEKHKEVLDTLHTKYGVPVENLDSLFKAARHEFPEGDYLAAVEQAIQALIARGEKPVELLNSGEDVIRVIEAARALMRRADDEGAVTLLREARQQKMAGAYRLALEEAEVLKAVFRWEEAIESFDIASGLNGQDPWPWFETGDIWKMRGDLIKSIDAYEKGKKIALDEGLERDLSVSHNRIGEIFQARGEGDAALEAYQAGLEIAENLARRDSENTEWQRDLWVSHNKIGDIFQARGEGDAALEAYQAGFEIAENLAKRDPENTEWQRDLSISRNKIGEIFQAHGDGDAALAAYQAGLEIRDTLAKRDPANSEWQRDLSVSHDRIGNIFQARGEGDAALEAYQAALEIRDTLAKRDPANSKWQRDLSVSHNKIGGIFGVRGEGDAALEAYQAGFEIAENLAKRDPENSEWQRDLIVSYVRFAELGDDAKQRYQNALAIARALKDDGRMQPVDFWMIEELEKRLAAAKG